MKKRIKKLQLHRETLLELDNSDYRKVAGGATDACSYTCATSCPSGHPGCCPTDTT